MDKLNTVLQSKQKNIYENEHKNNHRATVYRHYGNFLHSSK
jgi:hypothetical protein